MCAFIGSTATFFSLKTTHWSGCKFDLHLQKQGTDPRMEVFLSHPSPMRPFHFPRSESVPPKLWLMVCWLILLPQMHTLNMHLEGLIDPTSPFLTGRIMPMVYKINNLWLNLDDIQRLCVWPRFQNSLAGISVALKNFPSCRGETVWKTMQLKKFPFRLQKKFLMDSLYEPICRNIIKLCKKVVNISV